MTVSEQSLLAHLVGDLPELYQPIYGHPGLSSNVSRACDDRLRLIDDVYRAMATLRGRPLRVLDLGCAQGYFSLSLAAAGGQVTGLDMLPQNIAVCRMLAAEHPLLNMDFAEASIESVLRGLHPGQYDLVLGLSVFHHLIHTHGEAMVRGWIGKLGETAVAGIFEFALCSEPLPWAVSQPADERALLGDLAFVHELGRFPTHLSEIARPLYFASNRVWFLDGDTREFRSWKDRSHPLVGGVHEGTRRYFECDGAIAKVFGLVGGLADINLRELEREANFLAEPLAAIPAPPRLIAHGSNAREAWLVRERVAGTLLIEMMMRGDRYNARRVIRDILIELSALEDAGLFHNDVRAWNVVVRPDSSATLLDYGAISKGQDDCAWPTDPFMAFWIFVHDVAAGSVERIEPLRQPFMSPLSLPEEFREWALSVWSRPVGEWTFRLLLDCLDLSERDAGSVDASGVTLWMAAIEKHLDTTTSRAELVAARAEERAVRLGTSLAELGKKEESLAAELERARQRNEELLRTHLAQMSAAQQQLGERMGAIHAEIVKSAAREAQLGQALADAGDRIAELTRELIAANAAYSIIEQSDSWRITKPLRDAKRSLRTAGATLERLWRAFWRLPRRAARKVALVGLGHLRENPARKNRASRMLARIGWLDARLQRFARGNPADGMPAGGKFSSRQRGQTAQSSSAGGQYLFAARQDEQSSAALRHAYATRMAYIAELEKRLDEQAVRHREEIQRLTRDVDPLRS
jgi:O-antigen chain-terminating methyltransferase